MGTYRIDLALDVVQVLVEGVVVELYTRQFVDAVCCNPQTLLQSTRAPSSRPCTALCPPFPSSPPCAFATEMAHHCDHRRLLPLVEQLDLVKSSLGDERVIVVRLKPARRRNPRSFWKLGRRVTTVDSF